MKRISAFAVIAALAMSLLSCEKYEDGKPSRDVRTQFKDMYPDARDVEWEAERGLWQVSFETGTPPAVKEHEAWYDANGNWIRTETDILASELPQSVKDAIAASEYASAVILHDDIEYVTTPAGDYYSLELMYNGVKIRLNVTEGGEVAKPL